MGIKKPDHFERYKFYSDEGACIEICHSTEYTYSDAILFVESLGYEIREGGDIWYDDMFKDWRGYVNVVVSEEY